MLSFHSKNHAVFNLTFPKVQSLENRLNTIKSKQYRVEGIAKKTGEVNNYLTIAAKYDTLKTGLIQLYLRGVS